MMVTLAHELVHLSQVMLGRLSLRRINDLAIWCWDDEPYGTEPYEKSEWTLPWESEPTRKKVT